MAYGLGLPEPPSVHQTAVEIEPLRRLSIMKRIIGAELSCRGEAGDEAGLLTVEQGVSAAMPRTSLALNEAEQRDCQRDMAHVVDNVLKPPTLDDLTVLDFTDGVVRHQTWLVRGFRPWLLVMHDVRYFVIVGSRAVLIDMVASRAYRSSVIIR